MTCGRCGKNNTDNLKFCTGCGESLVRARAQPRVCSYCGSDIEAGNPFCGICGRQAGQARQAQQANEPVLDMRRPNEPRRQAAQQPRSRQSYDETPQRRAYSEPERQFRRQPQNAPTRQGQQGRRKAGFAGLPISRNAFFGIVGGIVAVVLIIVLVTSLTGGGESRTYVNFERGWAFRFSDRNFTIYEQDRGSSRFYEQVSVTYTREGDEILHYNGSIGPVRYDNSRNEIIWDGLRLARLGRSELRGLEFISEREGASIEQSSQPPERDGQNNQPIPEPDISQPPDSVSPLEGVWMILGFGSGYDDNIMEFSGDEFYISFYRTQHVFDRVLWEERGFFSEFRDETTYALHIFGRQSDHTDFPRFTLVETIVDDGPPYSIRELYRHEKTGTFSISNTAQGDVIELVWEDGIITVFDILVTQNTISASRDGGRTGDNRTEFIRRN